MNSFDLVRLKKEDCNELVSFLNRVFTLQNKKEVHFEKSTPRIYKEDDETMGYHIAAKKQEKIIGCAGTYPILYKVGGNKLKIGSVESIAVDPEYRGLGIMQEMIKKMEEENISEYDLCYLQGDRKRYSHFGFERCGILCAFNIKMSMLGKEAPKKNYKFEIVKDKNDELLKKIYDFYIAQETCRVREYEIFYDSMTTKGLIIHAVIDEQDQVCGYFLVDQSFTNINEIGFKDEEMFHDAFKCYMLLNELSIVYLALPIYHMLFQKAYEYCDRYTLSQPGCYKINNFKKVIESYMREKKKTDILLDGRLTIDSEIFGKWSISKNDDAISVEKYNGDAQIKLSSENTYQFLFGPLTNFKTEDKEVSILIKSWFPLPLYTPPML